MSEPQATDRAAGQGATRIAGLAAETVQKTTAVYSSKEKR